MFLDTMQSVGAPVASRYRSELFKAKERERPFGQRTPPKPDQFIDRLLSEPTYDAQVAYSLAVIAGWSYSHGQTLANKLQYFGLPLNTVNAIQVTNPPMLIVATAFLVRSKCGRVGVLSFRGTEPTSAINWLADADVTPRAVTGGKVHRGFYANLQAVWDEVVTCLDKAMEPGGATGGNGGAKESGGTERKPMEALYITGHSLGGAMATLAAAKIHQEPRYRAFLKAVYTFGQPAVGDASFGRECKDGFGDYYYRHVYRNDVVPHLPPRSSPGKYEHFGQERYSSASHEPYAVSLVERKPAKSVVWPILTCGVAAIARRLHPFADLKFPYSIDDHLPSRYIEASRAALAD